MSNPRAIEPTEAAWAAGFFDGEGSCGYYPKSRSLQMVVGQSSPELLLRFQEIVGLGSVSGSVRTISYDKTRTTTFWYWRVTNQNAIEKVFNILAPYLGQTKEEQIMTALSAFEMRATRGSKYDSATHLHSS